MNTNHELDRIVSDWLDARVVDPPHGSLAAALARAEQAPQQRYRWLQWWFARARGVTAGAAGRGRDDLAHVRRAHLTVGATATAAVVAVIVLLATIGSPQQTTVTVGPSDSDVGSISEAVAAAKDGDTVLVAPGTYEEALIIDKDITLVGTGDFPHDVVLRVPDGAPTAIVPLAPNDRRADRMALPEAPPVGIQLIESKATLRNLQVVGQRDDLDVLVSGGAPVLEDIVLRHDGSLELNASLAGGLFVEGGSSAIVRDSTIWHRTRIAGGSSPTFEGGSFEYGRLIIQDGASPVISDTAIRGECADSAVMVVGGASPVFRGNWMLKVELEIQGAVDDGTRATVVDNRFVSSNLVALRVTDGASATISGNSFTSSTQGLNVTDASAIVQANEFVSNINAMTLSNADAEVSGNTIRGGDYGVSVVSGGAPAITGNHIENAQQRGILVGGGTSPLVEGNTICGGAINLYVDPNANPKLGSNDVCPDGAAVAD